jgi:phosphoserine aminotransferase
MNDTPSIVLPPGLLPGDGRFGSGPSRVAVGALADLAATATSYMGTSHRQPTVKGVVAGIRSGLSELYALEDGYEVVLGVGGATAFWDAAAFGLIADASVHYVCGEFSAKFADVASAAPHLRSPVRVPADPGSAPLPTHPGNADVAAFIHNETSTGVLAPFARIGDALVVVDATSAAGAIEIDVADVDTYYFSPQKAFGSEGGLWVALMSPAAIARVGEIAASGRWIPPFLSLQGAIDNSRKDQTYNTPALATLYLLERQVRTLIDNGGLAWAHERSSASSGHLYRWAEASSFAEPFVTDRRFRSPTVVTIDLDESVDAGDVSRHLRTNGIVDTESYRKLGRNQLRIASFPTIPTEDIEALTGCIDFIVGAM